MRAACRQPLTFALRIPRKGLVLATAGMLSRGHGASTFALMAIKRPSATRRRPSDVPNIWHVRVAVPAHYTPRLAPHYDRAHDEIKGQFFWESEGRDPAPWVVRSSWGRAAGRNMPFTVVVAVPSELARTTRQAVNVAEQFVHDGIMAATQLGMDRPIGRMFDPDAPSWIDDTDSEIVD